MKKSTSSSQNIVLGVCGGIAAYKACEIARLFVKNDFSVQVMMTSAAEKFVTAMTFQALTGHKVATDLFDLTQESEIGHITMADQADLIVIAPATADILAKAAHGFADNIVSTVLLATKAPILFAPSMNVNMIENPVTQDNIAKLKKRRHHFIDPTEGYLACGWEGKGRLAEPEAVFAMAKKLIKGHP
jgi:phosphopantothenoylcysteine decarboxylase/phosphopantothenate--cysteine ligase